MPEQHKSGVVDLFHSQGYGVACRHVCDLMGIDFDTAIPMVDNILEEAGVSPE
jgi:hypothetical protein